MSNLLQRLRCGECGEPEPDVTRCLRCVAADEISRLSCEVSNLKLANKEARKTIDRLNELIPREANHGGPVSEGLAPDDEMISWEEGGIKSVTFEGKKYDAD